MRPPVDRTLARAKGGHRLAFEDPDFMWRDEMRAMRLAVEFAKADLIMRDWKIRSTIVFFGSARVPKLDTCQSDAAQDLVDNSDTAARTCNLSHAYFEMAHDFAYRVGALGVAAYQKCGTGHRDYVVVTGGGPGIMEAANLGAAKAGAPTIGLNINLVTEQQPNRHITAGLSFKFQYFAIRKMHFLLRARALAFFPGGFGTLDELFDVLCLMQSGKMQKIPILMFGGDYWRRIVDFEAMAEVGTISHADLDLLEWPLDVDNGWEILRHNNVIEDIGGNKMHDI